MPVSLSPTLHFSLLVSVSRMFSSTPTGQSTGPSAFDWTSAFELRVLTTFA